MKDFNKLIEIAADLQLDNVVGELLYLKSRAEMPDKDLIIPLVGEFSSGKTTLINSLTVSKKLETASKATTATIFEIRFGQPNEKAEVVDESGVVIETVDDIGAIKNELLPDKSIVRIFDISSKISKSTVLVDTPGLSSNDPRHRLALTSYLPKADAIFLISDINQQLTRSLTDFIGDSKLVGKPMYLILTKSDTKSENELADAKKYISENSKLPIDNIICISAIEDNMAEFFSLMDSIQKEKNSIVNKAIEGKQTDLAAYMLDYIDTLLKNAESPKELDKQIASEQKKLDVLKKNIEAVLDEARDKITFVEDDYKNKFSDSLSDKLDNIVRARSDNYDREVFAAVNSTASLLLSQYQGEVKNAISGIATSKKNTSQEIPLQTLGMIDLSSILPESYGFSYNLHLSGLGHEKDEAITNTIKGILAVGKTIVENINKSGNSYSEPDINAKKSATDYAKSFAAVGKEIFDEYEKVDSADNIVPNGFIGTSVYWITDQLSGKPQRRRAIQSYIEGSLIPEFNALLENSKSSLITVIGQLLNEEAKSSVEQKEDSLKKLKEQYEIQTEEFNRRIEQYKEYRTYLN